MQFASFVALAASFVAVQAVLQDGAQCLSNWTSIGDFCDVSKGLACVATGWGNGFCESYKCSTTLAAATSTINAFPVTVTSPSVTSTIYTTTTKQNFCDCPPYLYSTTTAYVTATPTSTQAFWGDCKTTGDCQKGLDCVHTTATSPSASRLPASTPSSELFHRSFPTPSQSPQPVTP
ncbi:hypothetical protein BKA62DRAFT_831502 [Auriculariales sp. MPI-PUGE-AT-0066]|nr:hypothetical protein BKA62DRAFT_831502 [Auriculariales sp. MPI-PUGE-AT-0066]